MPIPNKVRIKRLRDELGLTQEKLSKLANVSKRIVQAAEAGKNVSAHTLKRLARVLEVEVKDLLEKDRTIQSPLSATMGLLPPGDEHDPALASAFLSKIRAAMESYTRFKLKHNVINKNAIISPKEAREYFTAKWPDLIHQWLEIVCHVNSNNKMEIYYILNSTDILPEEVVDAVRPKDQSHPILSAHFLVVYKCVGEVSEDAAVQLEAWYGRPTMQHLFVRVDDEGKATSISGKGKLLRISTNCDQKSDNKKNIYMISQGKPLDELTIPAFGKARLNLKTGKFEKDEVLDGPSESPKGS